jgi:hypothetical protein
MSADAALLNGIARDEGSSKAAMVEVVHLYSNLSCSGSKF